METQNEIEKGIKFLRKTDPVMRQLISSATEHHTPIKRRPDPFTHLCRAIIHQQLATGAARTIEGRFLDLYNKKPPKPEQILKTDIRKLRKCGLSKQKISYLKDLAKKSLDGTVEIKKLNKLSDEKIIDELVKVKGIGVWTAQMFLMFNLGRLDVFPSGDLAIQNWMKKLYNLDPKMKPVELEKFSG